MDLSYSCVWLKMVVCDWLLTRHVTRHSFTYFAFLHLLALHWNCTETVLLFRAIEIGGVWLAADVSRDMSPISIFGPSSSAGTALKLPHFCVQLKLAAFDWQLTCHVTPHSFAYLAFPFTGTALELHWNRTETALNCDSLKFEDDFGIFGDGLIRFLC